MPEVIDALHDAMHVLLSTSFRVLAFLEFSLAALRPWPEAMARLLVAAILLGLAWLVT